ncbi:hypothetical protein [Streptomyces sulphureus]|uniref:hypothetical protein n=1 Tax=Streptomyces sulphureus TaxID=47758 RepID=UPI00037CAF71|nr:hypothetical protein [Streptomyces sulphureus]
MGEPDGVDQPARTPPALRSRADAARTAALVHTAVHRRPPTPTTGWHNTQRLRSGLDHRFQQVR